MPKLLNDDARAQALHGLPEWALASDSKSIAREFKFKDFVEAFGFMTQVAIRAQVMDHHPDWSNGYNRVSITLSTHDAGGLTDNDIALAQQIDAIVA
ncbi:MAG: 4a-hydroxytetrahydrobiopterin dehydratase [Sphingobium sp.]